MLWRFAEKMDPILKRIYQKVIQLPVPNLKGDRDLEYSWVAANLPDGPGEAMDFGWGGSWMGLLAARKGFRVIALDLTPISCFYKHPNLKFIQGDIFKLNFPKDHFDLIVNCSSIEHVGLRGRYSVTEFRPNGDIDAMEILKNILRPGKDMILTIPVGRDRVFNPLHRVYGESRLSRLLEGLEIVQREYWVKDRVNSWNCVSESIALDVEPTEYYYGLGLFLLRRPHREKP